MTAGTIERPRTAEEIYHLTDEDIESFFETVTPPDHSCQRRDKKCDRKAAVKTWWGGDTDVPSELRDNCRNTIELCQECFEHFSSGKIICHSCDQQGKILFKKIVYSESLR